MLTRRILVQTISARQLQIRIVRLYGRWTHRNPAKVLLPFESTSKTNLKKEKIINLDPKIVNKSEEQSQHTTEIVDDKTNSVFKVSLPPAKSKEVRSKKEENEKKRKFYLSQQKVFDDNSDIIFEKFKDNDSRIR